MEWDRRDAPLASHRLVYVFKGDLDRLVLVDLCSAHSRGKFLVYIAFADGQRCGKRELARLRIPQPRLYFIQEGVLAMLTNALLQIGRSIAIETQYISEAAPLRPKLGMRVLRLRCGVHTDSAVSHKDAVL